MKRTLAVLAVVLLANTSRADEAAAVPESAAAPESVPAVKAAPESVPAVKAAPESVVEGDVVPSLAIYSANGVSLVLGGLLQLHLAPYVGSDALLANDDPAQRAGFRLRRARFGVDASLPADFRFLLVFNPLQNDPEVGTLSEARLTWAPERSFRIW